MTYSKAHFKITAAGLASLHAQYLALTGLTAASLEKECADFEERRANMAHNSLSVEAVPARHALNGEIGFLELDAADFEEVFCAY